MTTPPPPSTVDPSDVRTATVASVLALALCGTFASCFLSGYEKVEGGTGGGGTTTAASVATATTQASSASQGGAGGEDLPRCETTETPPRPTDAPTTPELDRWFGLHVIRLGSPEQPASVPGLDLDDADTCNATCQGEPECAEPDFLSELTASQAQERCDFPGAVDNSSVYLFDLAGSFIGATDSDLSDQADAGQWSLLLRVSEWNGGEEDGSVMVSLYSTPGFQPPVEGGTSSTASGAGGAEPASPAWEGSDTWAIDGRSLAETGNIDAPAFQASGYVSGGTIVADLGGDFYVGTARIPVQIASGRLIAPLVVDDDDTASVRGAIFGGRWPVRDFLTALGALVIDGEPFCNQGSFFDNVAQRACRLVDVSVDQGISDCDSLSFGIGFDADPVRPGTVVEPMGEPADCPELTCAQLLAEE
jgi:hypothetical protein